MNKLRRFWRGTPSTIRKPLVLILGFMIIVTGVILLPLPGPGWLLIFVGFALLATEYEFAKRLETYVISRIKPVLEATGKRLKKLLGR